MHDEIMAIYEQISLNLNALRHIRDETNNKTVALAVVRLGEVQEILEKIVDG